jgi:L-rhamnose mutarotase
LNRRNRRRATWEVAPLERVCFRARIRADRLAEYRQRHQQVWPEMRAALSEAGWRNYSLFLSGDGMLIGYLETDDFAAAQRRMAETDVNRRWQAEMAPFFEDLGTVRPDEGMAPLAEIFHLD